MVVLVRLATVGVYCVLMVGLFLLLKWLEYNLHNYWAPFLILAAGVLLGWALSEPWERKLFLSEMRRKFSWRRR